MQLIDTPQAMKPETVICRGSFLAINNIAFSAHSEFKDKLFLLRTYTTYDPLSVLNLHLKTVQIYVRFRALHNVITKLNENNNQEMAHSER